MKTLYVYPSVVENGRHVTKSTENRNEYLLTSLEHINKHEYKYVACNDLLEFPFTYNLQDLIIAGHSIFFQLWQFQSHGRWNPTEQTLLLDNAGIDLYLRKSSSMRKFFFDGYSIPEYITQSGYVLHKTQDFLELDFEPYFKIYDVEFILKAILRHEILTTYEWNAYHNIDLWGKIFLREKIFDIWNNPNKLNDSKRKYKKLVKFMKHKKTTFALELLRNKIAKKKGSRNYNEGREFYL